MTSTQLSDDVELTVLVMEGLAVLILLPVVIWIVSCG